MSIDHSPATTETTDATGADAAAFEQAQTDMVLGGRTTATAHHLTGLIAAAQLDTVGTPRKLARDLFPDVDPAVVQEIWDRSAAVHYRAGQMSGAPRFHRDKLARLQRQLAEAGFAAMAGQVQRAVAMAVREHPADDASDGREH
ncbi:hypothetical protein ACFVWR_18475 [Leifsonia sp. NPDC058292]|uniref:hypothetical protein n=1 Tax=Leifsonia sp. NPDC058292 TaxID=3346428 RepID=UPI0036D765CF